MKKSLKKPKEEECKIKLFKKAEKKKIKFFQLIRIKIKFYLKKKKTEMQI